MFKRIDEKHEKIVGYSYANQDGEIEKVKVVDYTDICAIVLISPDETTVHVYREDIPNLVKALQAAYDHKD